MDTLEASNILYADDLKKRDQWNEIAKDEVFKPVYNYPSWHETREHPYRMLRKVTESKICSVLDFVDNPTNIFTSHERIAQLSPNAGIKFTVQFNLFGGSVQALATKRHEPIFAKIDDTSVLGCFCLTEFGYGNNAVKMETTVTYDEKTQEFVVHSPTVQSQKYWISNGFQHANHALVFGQTIVKGKNEGVQAFIVQVKDMLMRPMPGVTITDMGVKFGLNGVDNATVSFDHVRIPRENHMNKYADVTPEGEFVCDIKRNPQRFFKTTERLLSGRMCIAALALGCSKGAIYTALKYSQIRKSIGPEGESTVPIFDYQLQQNALMPLLARTIALQVQFNSSCAIFANPVGKEFELLSICCITKTMMGWNCERVASVGRERCGGMGYLAIARFSEYIAMAHAALTAEGDNRVLMAKIVKDIITDVTKNGRKLPEAKLNVKTQIGTFSDVTQLDTLVDLLRFREKTLFIRLTTRMAALKKSGKSTFEVMMRNVSDNIQDLAMAYGERLTIESCAAVLSQFKNAENRKVFEYVFRLFAMETVKQNLGFYLVEGAVSRTAASALIETEKAVVKVVASHANELLDSLNIMSDALYTPLATDYERYYSAPNYGEVHGARL